MRVLHVTESLGGGVQQAIESYMRNSPGVEHHLLASKRTRDMVPGVTQLAASYRELARLPVRASLQISHRVRALRPDIVHVHSSWAGVHARIAWLGLKRPKLIYTPHCYAFERTDTSWAMRLAVYGAEKALSRVADVVAGCSLRECSLALRLRKEQKVAFLPNVAPEIYSFSTGYEEGRNSAVVMTGRATNQKDPDFFACVAKRVRAERPDIEFIWIGDGSPATREMLSSSGVSVTGWTTPAHISATLERAGLYLHSSSWEGFPISLLEAHSKGVPILCRSIPAFGFVPGDVKVGSVAEAAALVIETLDDAEVRRQNREMWDHSLYRETPEGQKAALKMLYSVQDSTGAGAVRGVES